MSVLSSSHGILTRRILSLTFSVTVRFRRRNRTTSASQITTTLIFTILLELRSCDLETYLTRLRVCSSLWILPAPEMSSRRFPAVFDGKALKTPSSCPRHPKYQALRSPKSGCSECSEIWLGQVLDVPFTFTLK